MSAEDPIDPRGLIAEAYRMEGIGLAECRSIFLDWAISTPGGASPEECRALLARHGAERPDHPMTSILREGALAREQAPARRGGASARRR